METAAKITTASLGILALAGALGFLLFSNPSFPLAGVSTDDIINAVTYHVQVPQSPSQADEETPKEAEPASNAGNAGAITLASNTAVPATPVRIIIPSIGVDAPIKSLGLDAKGNVAVPTTPHETSWFNQSAKPGAMGASVITGHYGTWRNGSGSVFDKLNALKAGAVVYVKDSKGQVFGFKVTRAKTYGANDSPAEVYASSKAALNIITCSGDWLSGARTYTNRLVVFTERIYK